MLEWQFQLYRGMAEARSGKIKKFLQRLSWWEIVTRRA